MDNNSAEIKIIIRGIEYTTKDASMMMLAPMKSFLEDPSKVSGWEGVAYSLSELCNFDPHFPDKLAWHYHFINKEGLEQKKYGIRLNENEVLYIIQTFVKTLLPDDTQAQNLNIASITKKESSKGKGFDVKSISKNNQTEEKRKELLKQLEELELSQITIES